MVIWPSIVFAGHFDGNFDGVYTEILTEYWYILLSQCLFWTCNIHIVLVYYKPNMRVKVKSVNMNLPANATTKRTARRRRIHRDVYTRFIKFRFRAYDTVLISGWIFYENLHETYFLPRQLKNLIKIYLHVLITDKLDLYRIHFLGISDS